MALNVLRTFWGILKPSEIDTHLMALCLGLPGWAGTRKVKPIWIYWSKSQWVAVTSAEHMQICILSQTDNHASIQPLSFLQAGFPSCCPTNSVKALMPYWNTAGENTKSHGTLNLNYETWFCRYFLVNLSQPVDLDLYILSAQTRTHHSIFHTSPLCLSLCNFVYLHHWSHQFYHHLDLPYLS